MLKLLLALCVGAVSVAAQAQPWAQCGGNGWSGATTCTSGYTCQRENDWYYQCRPGSNTGNPPPTTTSGGQNPTRPTPIASLCTQYAYHAANGYEILNNLWGIDTATGGSQCTYYNGPSGNGIAFSSDWRWTGDENTVKTYIYAGRTMTRRRISDISRLPTSVQWSYNITNMRANVAYDIFTHPDPNHVNYNGEFELMIWLGVYGGIWPITESPTGSPVRQVNLAGYSWNLYTGWNGQMRVYSFLPANGNIYSFSADVKLFFNYLTAEFSFPERNQYMLIYQMGTEAFTGGPAYFNVPSFQAEVQ